MRVRLVILFFVFITLSRLAAAEAFDFPTVSLEFPGSWTFEPSNNGYMATSALDGQKIFFRAIGIPVSSQRPEQDAQRWLEAEKEIDWFFGAFLGEKRDTAVFDVPDSSQRLPNGATLREVVWHLKSDPNKGKFAAFAIKRERMAVIAMPGHHEHRSSSHLTRIKSILTHAKWN